MRPQRVPRLGPLIIGGDSPAGQGLPCAGPWKTSREQWKESKAYLELFWPCRFASLVSPHKILCEEELAATTKGCFPPALPPRSLSAPSLGLGGLKKCGFERRLQLATYSISWQLTEKERAKNKSPAQFPQLLRSMAASLCPAIFSAPSLQNVSTPGAPSELRATGTINTSFIHK